MKPSEPKIVRYLAKCDECGTAMSTEADDRIGNVAHKLDLEQKGLPLQPWDQDLVVGQLRYQANTGSLVMPCFKCGKMKKARQIRGKYNRNKACNAKCLSATGHDCECSCAGRNHGKNYSVD